MEMMVEMLAERIEIDKGAGTEPDLMQYNISHELYTFLEAEGGGLWQNYKGFPEEILAQMREAIETDQEENPRETQITIDARTTLQLQQYAMEVQHDAEGTGCDSIWVVQALLLALWTSAHTLHHQQKVWIESLEGKDASNPATEQPRGVKECL